MIVLVILTACAQLLLHSSFHRETAIPRYDIFPCPNAGLNSPEKISTYVFGHQQDGQEVQQG